MKTAVFAFGRMSPITKGHQAVIKKVTDLANSNQADHLVVLSHTSDKKNNPLKPEDKLSFAKSYFPNTNIKLASKEKPTFIHHVKDLSDSGVEHLIMVAGKDRVGEYKDLLDKYNDGSNHSFKKIDVVSSGERDDGDGLSGVSATKMRQYAKENDFNKFAIGAPEGDMKTHRKMFQATRSGMMLECFVEFIKKRSEKV